MNDLTQRISQLSPAKRELLARLLKQKGMANAHLPIMPRQASSDYLPLSYAQQRLWFLNQLEPESTVYNVNTIIPLAPALPAQVIEQSINEIIRRHESLRTTFLAVDGSPAQVIKPRFHFELPVIEIKSGPEAEKEREVMRLMREEADRPFDLSTLPLMRAVLVRLGEEDQLLLLTMHHIITDGLSVKIFTEELAALSEAFAAGQQSPLKELAIQYGDFALWQREWLQGEVMKEQLSYWKRQLSELSALNLPTDFVRPAVSSHLGADEPLKLSPELSANITELSRREGVTLFMTLLAAFGVLLGRYTRQDDIVVGTPVSGRDRIELENLIGFFINTLVLRIDLSGDPGFLELLGRVRETALGAYAHQDLPFEKLVEELHPERDLSRNPLFQVSFQLLPELDGPDETDAPTRSAEVEQGTAMFDLGLDIWESDAGLKGSIEYSTELFEQATIGRMAAHYCNLLESIARDPWRRVSELEMLSENERRQILSEWNDTSFDYPRTLCLHHLFEQQVERTPENIAVIFEQERLTYAELNRRANQLAHYLKKLGVGPDQIIGICMERSPKVLIGLLGILKAGGGYVALEPSQPSERLEFMLKDAGAQIVLTERRFAERLSAQIPHILSLDEDWEIIAGESAENPSSRVSPENLAVIIYTSGSTGRPKGVMLPHRGLCNRLLWGKKKGPYGLTDDDRLLQMFSFSFDFSVWDIFTTLICGAQLVLARPGGSQDSSYLVRLMAEQGITIVGLTPSLLEVLLNEPEIKNCRSLKKISSGGEALSVELQERLFAQLDTELHNTYGPTEASIDVTAWVCLPGSAERSVPIGHPNGNTQIYLLDERLRPVPIGVAGELHVGGENLARGYLNQPELTAAKFIPNPFSVEPGARLYKTGDLARYRADGEIEFLGRIDNQIKLRGFRIELGEIETALAGHASVLEAAVKTIESERNEKRLVGYVVPIEGQSLTSSGLRSYMEAKLPGYMVPSAFVLLEALPRTPNGKINRRALPVPDRTQPELEETFTAPRTQTEDLLAHIWGELLALDRIGIRDNFFALGGHSLLATQVISRVRSAFGIEVPLRSIFEKPTIADLAEAIEQAQRQLIGQSQAATSITRVSREQYRTKLTAHGVPEVSAALRDRLLPKNGKEMDAPEVVKAESTGAVDYGKP